MVYTTPTPTPTNTTPTTGKKKKRHLTLDFTHHARTRTHPPSAVWSLAGAGSVEPLERATWCGGVVPVEYCITHK